MPSFLEVATPLAVRVAEHIMELRKAPLIRERKADYSLVTNADKAADRMIRSGLHKAFPQHSILTEESGMEGSLTAEYIWVVDPVDGTRAYAKGVAGFSVMIGLLKDGQPFAGVVVDPLEGHIYEAMKGEGCFHTIKGKRQRVQVSNRLEWSDMPIITSTGFPPKIAKAIQAKWPCPWVPAINSIGIKAGLVIRQVADLYINHHYVHYWDTCAPQVLVEEAGGLFTYLNGKPLIYDLNTDFKHAWPTLASNGPRHQEFSRALQALF